MLDLNAIKCFVFLTESTQKSFIFFFPSVFVVLASHVYFGQEFDREVLVFPWENVGTLC